MHGVREGFIASAGVSKTFLFITMQGTPEARRLWEELKLRRPDVEYYQLDRPETFLLSDLVLDPDLSAALGKCGLDHLLANRPMEFQWPFEKKCAQSLQKYLGWKPLPPNVSERGELDDLPTQELSSELGPVQTTSEFTTE